MRKPPILLAALLLAGCYHPGRGLKSCRYTFRNLAFTGMDAGATHWKLRMDAANPNTHDVTLMRMRFSFLHQADTLLSGWNPEEHIIPARDSVSLLTTIDLPNAIFQKLPPDIWTQSDAQFQLVADAYLHTWMGDLMVAKAIDQTVHVDMTKQAARLKEMLMQKLFSWPSHLQEGGVPQPDTTTPSGPDPL